MSKTTNVYSLEVRERAVLFSTIASAQLNQAGLAVQC